MTSLCKVNENKVSWSPPHPEQSNKNKSKSNKRPGERDHGAWKITWCKTTYTHYMDPYNLFSILLPLWKHASIAPYCNHTTRHTRQTQAEWLHKKTWYMSAFANGANRGKDTSIRHQCWLVVWHQFLEIQTALWSARRYRLRFIITNVELQLIAVAKRARLQLRLPVLEQVMYISSFDPSAYHDSWTHVCWAKNDKISTLVNLQLWSKLVGMLPRKQLPRIKFLLQIHSFSDITCHVEGRYNAPPPASPADR